MTTPTTYAKATVARPRATWPARTPPRPIRTRAEHRAVMDELMRLARLVDAGNASQAQADAAEVLKLLVTDYESRRFGGLHKEGLGGTPVERLRYLLEEHGMGVTALGLLLGDRSLGTRILSGQRVLSKAHIRRLSTHFHVNPGYFL